MNPSEVWLKGEDDNRAYFPNDSGMFELNKADLNFGAIFIVQGPDLPPTQSPIPQMSITSTAQSSGGGASASYRCIPPGE